MTEGHDSRLFRPRAARELDRAFFIVAITSVAIGILALIEVVGGSSVAALPLPIASIAILFLATPLPRH